MRTSVSIAALVATLSAFSLSACAESPAAQHPPVAAEGQAQLGEDGPPLVGRVPAAIDPDGDLDPAGYALVTDVARGTLSLDPDGAYTFDPGEAFQHLAAAATDEVRFTYTAKDGAGAVSAPATITITVTGANDAPTVASPLADQAAAAGTAFALTVPAATFADVDDDDTLALAATPLPAWLAFDPASASFTGTPLPADAGTGAITVTATDAAGAAASDAFALTVTGPVVTPPSADEGYLYDAAGRLVEADFATTRVRYSYDQAGNVLRREILAPTEEAHP